jgi:arylsulfatase/arylsulfatase A
VKSDPLEMNNVADPFPESVTEMKSAYDAWFDDVGSTRPDNYAPPKIVIGSDPAPTTTLTRQDWRHLAGGNWGAKSLGYWITDWVQSGKYHCRVHLNPGSNSFKGSLKMTINNRTWMRNVDVSQGYVDFDIWMTDIDLGASDTRIELNDGEQTFGAYQVILTRQS